MQFTFWKIRELLKNEVKSNFFTFYLHIFKGNAYLCKYVVTAKIPSDDIVAYFSRNNNLTSN